MSGSGTRLTYVRYCDEIVRQADLLGAVLAEVSGSDPVPTCPGWVLDDLSRHVTGNLAALRAAVHGQPPPPEANTSRADAPQAGIPTAGEPSGAPVAGPEGGPVSAAQTEVAKLLDAASALADALRTAGPDGTAEVWGVRQPTAAWARRAAHELLLHRADAALAVGAEFAPATDATADALDELLDLTAAAPPLHGSGEELQLRTTASDGVDPSNGTAPSGWTVVLGPHGASWSRGCDGAEPYAVLQAPLTCLLLAAYRRLPLDDPRLTVTGDRELLNRWRAGTELD